MPAELMAQLRRAKPWLFGGTSSSSPASPPPAQPPRQKLATEMTDDEYRRRRARRILKHQLIEGDTRMGIQNFPAALQPIIQQGFLEREFQQALTVAPRLSRLRRSRADLGRHR